MREGDKRVVNIKDGEMKRREERGRGRLLSFSLHRGRNKKRGGRDSYPSPFIGKEMKGEEGRLLSFPFIMGKIKGKEIGSSEKESGDGQLIASTASRQECVYN